MKKIRQFRRWRNRRRFQKAYIILRKQADRHEAANHIVEFVAANESYIMLRCTSCPDLSA